MLSTQNSYKETQNWAKDLLSIAIFFGLFYTLWIGSYALFTPDEGRYSEVAREMVITGDYVTPRVNGVAFLDKPVLYYWLQASAINLFGLKEWALRFWPMLAGLLGIVLTYSAGRLLFNRRTGLLSAILLATCPVYYGAAHYANLDLEVAVLISGSLFSFIIAMRTENTLRQRTGFLIIAYIFAGLAFLTKGLIGIVFPAMIIGAWILTLNKWNILKKMRLGIGLVIFTAITLPWYILVQKANPEFFQFFFVKQQVARFLTADHFNNRTVFWFYAPIILAGIFPWTIFFFQALTQQIKSVWHNRQNHSIELFLLLWFFLIFLFFSIPKSKTIGYILPVFPVLALLLGNYLNQCWEKGITKGIRWGIGAYLFFCMGIAASCLLLPLAKLLDLHPQMTIYFKSVGVVFLISGALIGLFIRKKRFSQIFSILMATACIFLLIIIKSSDTINQNSTKTLALQIKSKIQPTDEIVTFYKYYQDLGIYLDLHQHITIVNNWNSPDIPLYDNWARELWYGMPFQDTKNWLIDEVEFWERYRSSYQNKRLYIFTNVKFASHFKQIEKLFHIKVYPLAQYNDIMVLSNRPEENADLI